MTYHFFMNLFIPDHTFFANLLSACFKLWFHKTYNPAAVFQQIPYRDQYLGQRNKSNIYGGKVNRVGNIFRRNIEASGVIPQISAVFGNCGGGLAVVPALSDFAFMEATKAKMFINSPNAIEGNRIEKCDTSAAKFQSEETGCVDYAGTEDEILTQIRELVSMLPLNNEGDVYTEECEDDLNRACASMDVMKGDARYLLSEISDGHAFFETKADYAKNMVTGFIK